MNTPPQKVGGRPAESCISNFEPYPVFVTYTEVIQPEIKRDHTFQSAELHLYVSSLAQEHGGHGRDLPFPRFGLSQAEHGDQKNKENGQADPQYPGCLFYAVHCHLLSIGFAQK